MTLYSGTLVLCTGSSGGTPVTSVSSLSLSTSDLLWASERESTRHVMAARLANCGKRAAGGGEGMQRRGRRWTVSVKGIVKCVGERAADTCPVKGSLLEGPDRPFRRPPSPSCATNSKIMPCARRDRSAYNFKRSDQVCLVNSNAASELRNGVIPPARWGGRCGHLEAGVSDRDGGDGLKQRWGEPAVEPPEAPDGVDPLDAAHGVGVLDRAVDMECTGGTGRVAAARAVGRSERSERSDRKEEEEASGGGCHHDAHK